MGWQRAAQVPGSARRRLAFIVNIEYNAASVGKIRSQEEAIDRLYHFTSLLHLGSILVDGSISRGEIPVSPSQSLNGIWATANRCSDAQPWARVSLVDKTEVRLEFGNKEDFQCWADLARELNIDPAWFIAFNEAGGPTAAQWFVSRKPVSLSAATIEVRRTPGGSYEAVTPATAKKLCLGMADRSLGAVETSARRLPPFRQRDAMTWLRKTKRQYSRLSGVEAPPVPVKEKFKWVAPGPWYS